MSSPSMRYRSCPLSTQSDSAMGWVCSGVLFPPSSSTSTTLSWPPESALFNFQVHTPPPKNHRRFPSPARRTTADKVACSLMAYPLSWDYSPMWD